ncbi:RNA polymerase sigma factor [Paenibacillus solisilvae]|uniref:RNA polymerase sigma factor n=1 Tax=Paenibacillus solisilvae TaxID=2486751 RepID=A0ABW0VZV1_9BACL
MSGAPDKFPVYPDEQGSSQYHTQSSKEQFEAVYQQYNSRIRHYLSTKVNPVHAEDLTQLVFMKVLQNLHTFRDESSLFTWIFKIARNTLLSEYRSQSRVRESASELSEFAAIPLDYAEQVEIRIDIRCAIQKLTALDQQIIELRFYAGCTLLEIAEIVGMRQSAVKNRYYRALERLRSELNEWGDITIMSIENRFAVIHKDDSDSSTPSSSTLNQQQQQQQQSKVHKDLFEELRLNVDRLSKTYKHASTRKIIFEIYPDLPAFHQAVGEPDAPNWFMGTYEGDVIKMVSPLNPGPEHTYRTILQSAVHLFAMWLITDINPGAPKWIRQGVGAYETKQMTAEYLRDTMVDAVKKGAIPHFADLDNDTWDFERMLGFQFSYKLVEFITAEYGLDALNKLIRSPYDYQGICKRSEIELREQWIAYMTKQQ